MINAEIITCDKCANLRRTGFQYWCGHRCLNNQLLEPEKNYCSHASLRKDAEPEGPFVPDKDGKTITLRQLLESIGDVFIQLEVGENEEITGMTKVLCNELCARRLNQKLGEVKVDNDMLVIRQEE